MNDSEVKIYTGHKEDSYEGLGDKSAQLFIKHRDSGNLQKADNLGKAAAKAAYNALHPYCEKAGYNRLRIFAYYVIISSFNDNIKDEILLSAVNSAFDESALEIFGDRPPKEAATKDVTMYRLEDMDDSDICILFKKICEENGYPELAPAAEEIKPAMEAAVKENILKVNFA